MSFVPNISARSSAYLKVIYAEKAFFDFRSIGLRLCEQDDEIPSKCPILKLKSNFDISNAKS